MIWLLRPSEWTESRNLVKKEKSMPPDIITRAFTPRGSLGAESRMKWGKVGSIAQCTFTLKHTYSSAGFTKVLGKQQLLLSACGVAYTLHSIMHRSSMQQEMHILLGTDLGTMLNIVSYIWTSATCLASGWARMACHSATPYILKTSLSSSSSSSSSSSLCGFCMHEWL